MLNRTLKQKISGGTFAADVVLLLSEVDQSELQGNLPPSV